MPKINPTIAASRRHMKMERIARFELAGYSDIEIALVVGITKTYVSMLRQTPEYMSIRVSVASGVLGSLTNDMDEDIKASQDQLKQMVPSAVLALRNTLHSSNEKLRLDAAKEIMDREGTLAKVSKTEIKKTNIFDFNANDAIMPDLLSALNSTTRETVDALLREEDFVTEGKAKIATQDEINAILNLETLDPASDSVN